MMLIVAQSFLPNAVLAVIGLIGGALALFWLWMAVDCLIHEPESTQKSGWLLAILFGNWIGALLYFFIRRRERLNPSHANLLTANKAAPAAPSQGKAAPIAMDGEIVSFAVVPSPATASSIARPSDWSLLRLLLMILSVLVVLPAALVVVMYCFFLAMTFFTLRQDNQRMGELRKAAEDGHAEFQERVAAQREEFQKRVAEQQNEFQKQVAEQQASQRKHANLGKLQAEPTGNPVTFSTPLAAGDAVLCSWGLEWYRVTVLEIQPGGGVKIHWQNWDDFFDEVVPRERLQLPARTVDDERAKPK